MNNSLIENELKNYVKIRRYVKQGKVIEESTTVYHRDRSLSVNEASKPTTLPYNMGIELNSEVKPYNGMFLNEFLFN